MSYQTNRESIGASTDKPSEFMGLFSMIYFFVIWGIFLLGIVAFSLVLPVVIIVRAGLSNPVSVLCLVWLVIVVLTASTSYRYFR